MLVQDFWNLFAAGLAKAIKREYATGARYRQFCSREDLAPFPTSKEILLPFIGHLHLEELSHGTKNYLAAVRFQRISCWMWNPSIASMPKLEYVLRGAKKKTPVSTRLWLPIIPHLLSQLKTCRKGIKLRGMHKCFGQQPAFAFLVFWGLEKW